MRRINRQSRRFSYRESYRRRFNSLLFRTCDVFRALINSLCCVFSQFCRLLPVILFFVSSCKVNVGPKQSEGRLAPGSVSSPRALCRCSRLVLYLMIGNRGSSGNTPEKSQLQVIIRFFELAALSHVSGNEQCQSST